MPNKVHLRCWLLSVFLSILVNGCANGQHDTAHVCITKTGKKYHECSCHYLRYSSYEITIKEAKKRGYTACSVCAPGDGGESRVKSTGSEVEKKQQAVQQESVAPEKQEQVTAKQCTAVTKAGTRCKRITSISNGRCWQHQ